MHLIKPISSFDLEIDAPCSKSEAQRAIALALCINGKTTITGLSECNDIKIAIEIIKKCGAVINWNHTKLDIISKGIFLKKNTLIDSQESGLSCRMFTSLIASQKMPFQIEGSGSLLKRDMSFFEKHFSELNASIKTNNHKLPFEVNGPIKPINIELDSMGSSQYITGLIYAYFYLDANNVSIFIKNPVSIPYIDLSIEMVNKFGGNIKRNNNEIVFKSKKTLNKCELEIQGDWSAGAFWLVAGAIYGKIKINGLKSNSLQADKRIMDAIKEFGASIHSSSNSILIQKERNNIIDFDASNCPDLFPPLALLCSHSDGVSKIHGVKRLINKESNRSNSLVKEFIKFGIKIWVENDTMFIDGNSKLTTPNQPINSHNDHRIAMATSMLSLGCKSTVKINNSKCVNKSYSGFYNEIDKLYI